MISFEEEEQLRACLQAKPEDLTPTTVAWLIKALNETHTELVQLYATIYTEEEAIIIRNALKQLQSTGLSRAQARERLRSITRSKGISKINAAKRILSDVE